MPSAQASRIGLHAALKRTLTKPLNEARASLDRGDVQAAIGQLEVFIQAVEAERGGRIVEEAAVDLLGRAQAVMAMLTAMLTATPLPTATPTARPTATLLPTETSVESATSTPIETLAGATTESSGG